MKQDDVYKNSRRRAARAFAWLVAITVLATLACFLIAVSTTSTPARVGASIPWGLAWGIVARILKNEIDRALELSWSTGYVEGTEDAYRLRNGNAS